MAIKIEIQGTTVKQIMAPETVIALGHDAELFPLFTKKDMAERWGVTIALISMWSKRHSDFPKTATGILVSEPVGGKGGGAGVGGLYPFYEVKRYEQTRGLAHE